MLILKSRVAGEGLVPTPSLPGVVLKDILDALAMVDIPVNDEDPGDRQLWGHGGQGLPPPDQEPGPGWEGAGWGPSKAPSTPFPAGLDLTLQPERHKPVQPVLPLGMSGRYGHVVEHAESIGGSPLAMVPRRPGGGSGVWGVSGSSCVLTGLPTGRGGQGRGQLSPHQGEPVAHSSRQHCIHQLQRRPHSQPGTVEGTLPGQGCR